ncbi:hypothetical protein PTKIN_Ptkin14bG0141200 [Pterospermum kingtungense]
MADVLSNDPELLRWKKPPFLVLKHDVDASIIARSDVVGLDKVFWGLQLMDLLLLLGLLLLMVPSSVKEGEAMGLLQAITWVKELDYQRLIFELDAQVVIDAVRIGAGDDTELGSVIESCRYHLICIRKPISLKVLLGDEQIGLLML